MDIQRKYIPGKDPEVGVKLGFIKFGKESSVASVVRKEESRKKGSEVVWPGYVGPL